MIGYRPSHTEDQRCTPAKPDLVSTNERSLGVAAPALHKRREPSSAHTIVNFRMVCVISLLGAHRETKSFTRIPEGAIVERGFIHIIPFQQRRSQSG